MAKAWRPPYLFPAGAQLGSDNVVLQARARRHRVEGYPGPLSIKTVLAGEVAWIVGGRELVVDPSSFLILSTGERYSMNIDAAKPVETCCVFFAPGFVETVALDLTTPLERALDAPERAAPRFPFLSTLHGDRERVLLDRVQGLAPRCHGALAPSGFEEDFLELAHALLGFYQRIREQVAGIPAAKESTRRELFRRLLIGREYMHSVSGPASLAAAARAGCLSPFHFHRGFTHAFQQTPHAYVTALRLARARRAIESGSTVLDAGVEAGFASPSAFTRAFRSRYGEPPSAVRKIRKIGQDA
ncbi:MAG TPA: AraC family transcriptional regulator [Bryobacteraceae bacterium]|jgi:AraC-like DNA-binding protein